MSITRSKQYIERHYDFIVVGGGMTGICAALAAARNGAKTALIHDRPVLGGNASSEIRMHICGANCNTKKPELSEGGIVHELMLANKRVNDSYNFSIWDAVLFQTVKQQENLTVYLNTTMVDAVMEEHSVKNIECYQMTTEKRLLLSADIFSDCTGNGTLCHFVGAAHRSGFEAKSETGEPHALDSASNKCMGNTLLFKAVDTGHPIEFIPPVDIIHFTEEQLKYRKHTATVPKELIQSVNPEELDLMYGGFCPDYGFWWLEISGQSDNVVEEYEDIRDQLVKVVYGVWDHIKNGGDHGAQNYELSWVGMLPGVRESRRIECDYMLTELDVLGQRRFDDKVAYGGWPVDDHRFDLFDFDHIPTVSYHFPGAYDIPYRSYCVKDFDNLFVGGRCMGATKLGMSSTRVMGTCAIGGQAIGTAAAILTQKNETNIRNIDIQKLQQQLIKDDCYLCDLVNQDSQDIARNAQVTASSEEDGFCADSIVNGVTREIGETSNQWRAPVDKYNSPWINLALEGVHKISTVQITFDSNFQIDKKITLSSIRQKQQIIGIPKELVKDYEVALFYKGQMVSRKTVIDNFQRMNRIEFEPVLCDEVKITVLATNGDPMARVFEVRIY